MRADVLTLIGEVPGAHGRFETPAVIPRQVYCTVRSVGMRETYEALANGLHPEYVFQLTHSFEYNGEKRCIFHDQEYNIIRTYITEADGIEITVERGNQHV